MSRFKPDDTTLTPAHERLIAAILSTTTVRDAAKKANISEKTAWNYLALPQVKAALQQARDDIRQQTIDVLKSQMLQSVQTIIELRDDTEVPPQYRLKAAQIVLELATKNAADPSTGLEESAPYDVREVMRYMTPEQIAIIKPFFAEASAKKAAEQEQPGQHTPSIRMVK